MWFPFDFKTWICIFHSFKRRKILKSYKERLLKSWEQSSNFIPFTFRRMSPGSYWWLIFASNENRFNWLKAFKVNCSSLLRLLLEIFWVVKQNRGSSMKQIVYFDIPSIIIQLKPYRHSDFMSNVDIENIFEHFFEKWYKSYKLNDQKGPTNFK